MAGAGASATHRHNAVSPPPPHRDGLAARHDTVAMPRPRLTLQPHVQRHFEGVSRKVGAAGPAPAILLARPLAPWAAYRGDR